MSTKDLLRRHLRLFVVSEAIDVWKNKVILLSVVKTYRLFTECTDTFNVMCKC